MANEYLIKKETLDNIATQSLKLAGKTEAVSPSVIVSDLTDANTEVDTQTALLEQALAALENKTSGTLDTSDATATADSIEQGKTAYVNGEKVEGTLPVDPESTRWGYATGHGMPLIYPPDMEGSPVRCLRLDREVSEKSIISEGGTLITLLPAELFGDATAADVIAGKTFTSEEGLEITGTKEEPVTVEQATPEITVASTGLITATATQTAGLVSAGTKSATTQLSTQAAKTVTPGTSDQTAVSSGKYTTGIVKVAGDANLKSENIAEGVSIFGITGTHSGGSGGDTDVEDSVINRTVTSYTNSRITTIGADAFAYCDSLTSANFPNAQTISSSAFYYCTSLSSISVPSLLTIGSNAFRYCYKLASVNCPKVTTIYPSAFYGCSRITSASFPVATSVGQYAFYGCSSISSLRFPKLSSIGASAFRNCSSLSSIYLLGSSVCYLNNSGAFSGTGITSTAGSIFVPSSLVASYKADTNWAYFSNRIYSGT